MQQTLDVSRKPSHRGRTLLILIALAALGIGALTAFRVGGEPTIEISPKLPGIGARTPVAVTVDEPRRGVKRVTVQLVQGDRVETLADESYPTRPAWAFWGRMQPRVQLAEEVGSETVSGLAEGEATLRVTAERAPTWLRRPAPAVRELTLPVRLRPPTLGLVSSQHNSVQGGSGVVVYRVGEGAVESGVAVGDRWFPGYPLPGGDAAERFAFYAVPYDVDDPAQVRLAVADALGNRGRTAFLDKFTPKPYAHGEIHLDDEFIDRAVPEILGNTPGFAGGATPLDSYLAINGKLRAQEAEQLRKLAADSRPEFLWHQPFLPMHNAKVMSPFAEDRTYLYDGRKVDEQFHLGFDLASVARAPIEAANDGVVVLASYFGIYGNAVVIDHGYGLASLYGHLSRIDVKVGDRVARGQEIGRSGKTGLAGGDHLHFAVLLDGLPVNPLEWWDGKWIRDHVADKLGPALRYRE
jgi:murein DD-endopeptidase MepM/ murein hydrolase activator NlpD